jgi:hypothetical protein
VDFGKRMGGMVKDMLSPLMKRIEALESRQLPDGALDAAAEASAAKAVAKYFELNPVKHGEDAKPVDAGALVSDVLSKIDIKSHVLPELPALIGKHFEANPVEPGKPGEDAIAPTAQEVAAVLAGQIDLKSMVLPELPSLIAKHFEAHPVEPGKDADPINIADVAAEILESDAFKMITGLQLSKAVDIHFVNNPVLDGKSPDPITDEQIAKQVVAYIKANPPAKGDKGDAGDPGIGLAGAMIDREGELIITTTKGEAVRLGRVVGKDGDNGDNGLSMSEVSRTYDPDTHEVVERWAVADEKKELRYPAGGLRPGGFYRDGMKALPLQVVTHDGCAWVALKETKAKPCHENKDDWQLLVRKGRDGDSYREKKEPEPVRLKADA